MRTAIALTLAAAALFAPPQQAAAQDRTFGGYTCTDDCEGHAAGFKWAERKGIHDAGSCPFGNSLSFHEGCMAYVEDPSHDADEDDDGNQVGVPFVEQPMHDPDEDGDSDQSDEDK